MTTITRSSKIGEKAEKIVDEILTACCKVRKEVPDVHIDFIAEIEEDGEPTGKRFGVQVKGTENPKIKNGLVKFSFEAKSLRYYINKVKFPVFLIVVDMKNREGYWLFTQKFLKETSILEKRKEQKKISINIPQENKISDTLTFIRIADSAQNYMLELWPASLHAAAAAEKKKWSELDERFDISVEYHNSTTNIKCTAREEMPFQLHFKLGDNQNLREKLIALFDQGRRVEFAPQEIQFAGSPILQKLNEFPLIAIEASNRRDVELFLTVVDHEGRDISKPYRIDGVFVSGRKEVRFVSKKQNLPLNLSLTIVYPDSSASSKEEYEQHVGDFNFNDTVWEGKSFNELQYFDSLSALFHSLKADSKISMTYEQDGNRLIRGYMLNPFEESFINNIAGFCSLIEKIRFISKYLNLV